MRPEDDCLRVWHEPGYPESSRTSADVDGELWRSQVTSGGQTRGDRRVFGDWAVGWQRGRARPEGDVDGPEDDCHGSSTSRGTPSLPGLMRKGRGNLETKNEKW